MSTEALTWAVKAHCQSGNEKAILLVIANYVGADGTCWPGQATIASQACCSEKTVERSLKAFEERGWIERVARRRRDGSRTSDLITLMLVEHPEPIENAQPDTLSDRPEPTRHPVQANPTPCPDQPDTVTGLKRHVGRAQGRVSVVSGGRELFFGTPRQVLEEIEIAEEFGTL